MVDATESAPLLRDIAIAVLLKIQMRLDVQSNPVQSAPTMTSTPTIKTQAPSPTSDPMDMSTHTAANPPVNGNGHVDGNGSDTGNGNGNTNANSNGTGSGNANTTPEQDGRDSGPDTNHPAGGGDQAPSSASAGANLGIANNNASDMPAPAPASAAAAIHQPKIVQTAFIHKLYNMLEDKNIQHLISWTPTAESFVMSPGAEFSKVLASYFKHTNVSSFVRQLNMYGFHKVSDVFHGAPDAAVWEFKHGGGSFKRGDITGLREIKRRASRHALVHREYNQKTTPSQPGTPAEPMPPMHEGGSEHKVASMESTIYDLSSRLQRNEAHTQSLEIRQQMTMEALHSLLSTTQEISRLFSQGPSTTQRDVISVQSELQRQVEHLRSIEETPPEPPLSSSRHLFSNIENPPVSPRQLPQDDSRRPLLSSSRANHYRPPVPSSLALNARRPFGSIGGTGPSSPSPLRSQAPAPAPAPPPAPSHYAPPTEPPPSLMGRRHTSADIRAHGWQPQPNPPSYALVSGPPSGHYPSSPSRGPPVPEDPRLHESLSQYSFQGASQSRSRPATPPPFSNGNSGLDGLNNWDWKSATSSSRNISDNRNLAVEDSSAMSSRRGSMAHILNPPEPRSDEDDPRGAKRKKLQ